MTLYTLIPFLKTKTKKMRKPGCPRRKIQNGRQIAKNSFFDHNSKIFCSIYIILVAIPMFWGIRNHSMQISFHHSLSFSWNSHFCSKLSHEGAFPKSTHHIENVDFNIQKIGEGFIPNISWKFDLNSVFCSETASFLMS